MLRRAARERREFVYKKAIEQRQRVIEDKRERLKHALDGRLLCQRAFLTWGHKNSFLLGSFHLIVENRLIPTDLRKDALDIQKNIDWKDPGADGRLMDSAQLDLSPMVGERMLNLNRNREPDGQ